MKRSKRKGIIMDELIKKLKASLDELEAHDDPTGSDDYRQKIGEAHYHLSECVETLIAMKE
jgi:hypothetical protein